MPGTNSASKRRHALARFKRQWHPRALLPWVQQSPRSSVALLPARALAFGIVGVTLVLLLVLGGLAARLGGASVTRGALRVAFWGAAAMGFTALVGHLVGVVV